MTIWELPTSIVDQLVRASGRQSEVLGLNHINCQIFNLFCQILSSTLAWPSTGRFNFDNSLHNNNGD